MQVIEKSPRTSVAICLKQNPEYGAPVLSRQFVDSRVSAFPVHFLGQKRDFQFGINGYAS